MEEALILNTVYGPIYGKEFNLPEIYQPVFGQEFLHPRARQSLARLEIILNADKAFNQSKIFNSSIVDFGSNLGHFSMSLEQRGCVGKITGIEIQPEWRAAANHIAKAVSSKCVFEKDLVSAEVFMLLSVTHHLMSDSTYTGMNKIFEFIDSCKAHTIYVEQATHLEYPSWASRFTVSTNPYVYFLKELEKINNFSYSVRLIGVNRDERLNTIRPIYQLKRKISERVTIDDKEFTIYDKWEFPFLGVSQLNFIPNYGFATDFDNKHYFIKSKNGVWYKPELKIDGLLLSDIFRFGIIQFYDLKKIKYQITEFYGKNNEKVTDIRPWNIVVSENSDVYFIDSEEYIPTDESKLSDLTAVTILKILLDSTVGG